MSNCCRTSDYNKQFPEAALDTSKEDYPVLKKNKLKTEPLIYSNDEIRSCTGAVALFQLFVENTLQDIFSETVTLLSIVITTPITRAESEKCLQL